MFVVLLHFYSSRPTPAYGEIGAALRRRSHRVWIGQPSPDGSFVFLDAHGEVARLPARFGRLRSIPFMLRLRRYLATLKADVVQITPHPWSWLLAVSPSPRTVLLNDIRTAGSGAGGGLRAWLVDASAWVSWRVGAVLWYDATLFLNESGARWLFGTKWRERGHVVPLGVGSGFLAAVPRDVAPRPDGPVRFVYLGTISLQRNLERIVLAARAVHARTAALRVTLLGPDDGNGGVAAIQSLIDRHRLQDVIDIAKPVPYEQVASTLGAFDMALNYVPDTRVQRRQTFMKTLECRALGLPQITTRTIPNAQSVADGDTGLLVEDSIEAYAAAMQRVIDDRSLLVRLSRGAHQARCAVSWDDVAGQYVAVYESLRGQQAP